MISRVQIQGNRHFKEQTLSKAHNGQRRCVPEKGTFNPYMTETFCLYMIEIIKKKLLLHLI